MDSLSLSNEKVAVTALVRRGILRLLGRTAATQLLRVVSSLILARLLYPKDYGLFGFVSIVVSFAAYFTDVGLGVTLLRQQEEPSEQELATVASLQMMLAIAVTIVLMLAAPIIASTGHVGHAGIPLIQIMAIGLPISAVAIVPIVLLERNLTYGPIAAAELLSTIGGTAITLGAAVIGAGVWSFIFGTLAQRILYSAALLRSTRITPKFHFDMQIAKRLGKFGILFQLNLLISSLLGGLAPILVGSMAGLTSLGLVLWSTNIVNTPMMIGQVIGRVTLPAFAKLQTDSNALFDVVRQTLRIVCLGLAPLFALIVGLAEPGIRDVFGVRWLPAIPIVQILSVSVFFEIINFLLTSLQNALGRSGVRLGVTILSLSLRISISVPLIMLLAGVGYAIATAVGSCFELLFSVVTLARFSNIKLQVYSGMVKPIIIFTIMATIYSILAHLFTLTIIDIIGISLGGSVMYIVLAALLNEQPIHLIRSLLISTVDTKNSADCSSATLVSFKERV